jgi:Transposase IS4
MGGDWINGGLPHYVKMERKPEAGCEIQSACCGSSSIMMALRVVKEEHEEDKTLKHGVKVMLGLLHRWPPKGRVVCADSYFASVQAAVELYKIGWRFIGVVKTAYVQYPKKFLESIELPQRGTCAGLRTRHCIEEDDVDDVDLDLLAFVFCDKNRHYFISTCSSLSAGVPIQRIRTQQVEEVETNADPQRLLLTIHQPKAAATYYTACGKIDQHNRARQDTLNLEKKMETKEWHRRVNMSIFGMVVVDSWMLYKGCTGGKKMHQSDYYKALIDGLIDNVYYDQSEARNRVSARSVSYSSYNYGGGSGTSGSGLHLTPTKRKIDSATPSGSKRVQYRCKKCDMKTTMVCSICRQAGKNGDSRAAYCHPVTDRDCFRAHMVKDHK